MSHITCDECETVNHCTQHGCIPKQPANQVDDINVADMPTIGCVNHDCDKCKAQQQEIDELTAQRDFLADILTRTANALKGQPAELSSHSWHDLPEVAQQIKAAQQQEPVAVVDANDDGYWAEILPDRNVEVGQLLYASPPASKQAAHGIKGEA